MITAKMGMHDDAGQCDEGAEGAYMKVKLSSSRQNKIGGVLLGMCSKLAQVHDTERQVQMLQSTGT